MLPSSQVRRYYGIRWQVEIIFKAWKQNSQFHKIKKMNVNRYEFLLYAKLIWIIISWKLYQVIDMITYKKYRMRISVLKMFKTLGQMGEQIKAVFRARPGSLSNLMQHLEKISKTHLVHDDRISRINWRNVNNY
jgi:hypothetical protein